MSAELSKESHGEIENLLKRYPTKRAALLPILHVVQKQFGYIPEDQEQVVADIIETPVVKIREVIAFYTMFLQKPVGKKHLQVCRTNSCWLRGAEAIIRHIEKTLDITDGKSTEDMKFTLTEVECLGACEHAPMMQLNDDYILDLTIEKVNKILNEAD